MHVEKPCAFSFNSLACFMNAGKWEADYFFDFKKVVN